MTDAGLALNGLTGIEPLTITIAAITRPSSSPSFSSPCVLFLARLSLPFSLSRCLSLSLPTEPPVSRSPSSLPPVTTIVTRPSSSADPPVRLRLFKVTPGNMSKSTWHPLWFGDSRRESDGMRSDRISMLFDSKRSFSKFPRYTYANRGTVKRSR